MDAEVAREALSLFDAGAAFAWVGILDTVGSSPRHEGASMLVRGDGSITGTVGGGSLEAWAITQALGVLHTGLASVEEFELTAENAAGLGMVCGGHGRVVIEPLGPSSQTVREVLTGLVTMIEEGGRGWLVTSVTGSGEEGWSVTRELVHATGLAGSPAQRPEGVAESGGLVYAEPVGFQGTAYVFGAGHCGEKLVPMLALAGFSTVILDDRAEFANRDRFPSADGIVVLDSFDQGLDALPIGEDSYVVIVTRGHLHDRSVLVQALRTAAAYVGMIGSRRKIATIYEALRDEGFSEEDLSRVHAPIGLAIGAETPGEIAVSIAAEMVQERAELLKRRSRL